jgi:hypothetical protein
LRKVEVEEDEERLLKNAYRIQAQWRKDEGEEDEERH